MANNFSGDPNCVALWNFESGAFVDDSIGNNDLTNDGADEETTLFKQGSQSAKFVRNNTDVMTIADADLDEGFPWRYDDTPTEEKSYSACVWVYLNSTPSENMYIFSKYSPGDNLRVIQLFVDYGSDRLYLGAGHTSGTAVENIPHLTKLVVNRWYHIGVTYRVSDWQAVIRIWDDTAGAIHGTSTDDNFSQAIDNMDVLLSIGSRSDGSRPLDGYLDEMVFFNRVITSDEIDAIRAGTFSMGWTGKINGVTNPAKINGIAVADIAKVCGV